MNFICSMGSPSNQIGQLRVRVAVYNNDIRRRQRFHIVRIQSFQWSQIPKTANLKKLNLKLKANKLNVIERKIFSVRQANNHDVITAE